MALFSAGSSLIYHLAPFVLSVTTISYLFILPLVVFPKAVLCPLLFIMYTTPLSTLISSLSLDHHLYADET